MAVAVEESGSRSMMILINDECNSNDDSESTPTATNPFSVLPPEMLAEIFSHLDSKYRQRLRLVSRLWKLVVDNFYGIHLHVTNINWNWLENCNCANSIVLNGFSRDVRCPDIITYFMPILEECYMLESLIINCATFLQKSQLSEYSSPEYMETTGKEGWLPRLKNFKFISCTTQGGVYNHVAPAEMHGDMFDFEDIVSRTSHDISRGEMEFVPFILQILSHAKNLAHVEMVLTDIWKIPFSDLLQINVDAPPSGLDISLWHFGSKRLLPVGHLFQKPNSISSLRFSFPYHFDTFFIKFKPRHRLQEANQPSQLEEVVIQQTFRWSQEMSQVDIPWLQILENQNSLKILEYPFPVFGNDGRMANIIMRNSKTLQKVVFTGHREERELLEDFRGGRLQSWSAGWFASCENLQELGLKANTRFLLTPTNIATISDLHLLPQSLKHFTFHGSVDTGNNSLSSAFINLVNLESLTHQARLCPWFKIEGMSIAQMQISHAMNLIMSLPKLKRWTLEWSDMSSAMVAHAVVNSHSQRQTACVSKQLIDWMGRMNESLTVCETQLDRHLKSLTVNILSHQFFNQQTLH